MDVAAIKAKSNPQKCAPRCRKVALPKPQSTGNEGSVSDTFGQKLRIGAARPKTRPRAYVLDAFRSDLQKASPGSRNPKKLRFWQSTFLVQWTMEEESRLTFGASNSQIGAPLFLPKCKTAHICIQVVAFGPGRACRPC